MFSVFPHFVLLRNLKFHEFCIFETAGEGSKLDPNIPNCLLCCILLIKIGFFHFFSLRNVRKFGKLENPLKSALKTQQKLETDKINAPKRGVKVLLPPCRSYVFRFNFKQQQFFIFRRPYLQSQPTNFCVIYLQYRIKTQNRFSIIICTRNSFV